MENAMHLPNDKTRLVESLIPYKNNARTHSKEQINQIAQSIKRFGFTNPVLIADDDSIIAGHGRILTAKQLGIMEVPIRLLSHLNEEERRAYILADNKLAENAGWDGDLLQIELQGLIDLEFGMDIIGFSTAELDLVFSDADGEIMYLMFTDPPYNVPINGHVTGKGKHEHREFEFASGEMNQVEFTQFLRQTLSNAASALKDGAISYVCMDWRHMEEMLTASKEVFGELKNLCIWNKNNGGMGSFYRSKHELVFVFKKGKAAHTNNFGLGENGRYRTNVWDYAGINSISATRDEDLAMHPTVKPVGLIGDAIMDCSHRGENILDTFGGSGSTLIAAEQTGRTAYLLELDPIYCDTIIKRFEKTTDKEVIHQKSGKTFTELFNERLGEGTLSNTPPPYTLSKEAEHA